MTDSTEPTTLVCRRSAHGPPAVPSYSDVCHTCGALVWRSERSRAFDGPVMCLEDFLAAAGSSDDGPAIVAPAGWAAEDIAEARRRTAARRW
jgi:hypothetical protein